MAEFETVVARTAIADADMRTVQYHLLRASSQGRVNVSSQANGGLSDIVGVLQNKPNTNQHATVGYRGISKVVAGAAISVHRFLTTNGSGRAIAANSGDLVCGQALSAAGADGEVIDALLKFPALPWGVSSLGV